MSDMSEQILTARDVAAMFGVDPKTISRWADAGHLDCLRTPGGHRRYRREDVEELMTSADAK